MSQAVEGMWIHTGAYKWLRGEWVNKNTIIRLNVYTSSVQSVIVISFQCYLPCNGTKEQFSLAQIVMLYKATNPNLLILLVKIHVPLTKSRNEEKFLTTLYLYSEDAYVHVRWRQITLWKCFNYQIKLQLVTCSIKIFQMFLKFIACTLWLSAWFPETKK